MKMNHRAFKSQVNGQFARIANPHRLEIVDLLAQGERCVEDAEKETELSIANASQHLQALREAHLIISRKEGVRVFDRLADPLVFCLVQIIREVAEQQLAEVARIVDTFVADRKSMGPLTLNELLERLHEPGLVILDVRPALEFAQGHILGARSIPIADLVARLRELSPEQEIVAYCRGPYCVFADEAVDLLVAYGYQARRLNKGYPDWQVVGLPTDSG